MSDSEVTWNGNRWDGGSGTVDTADIAFRFDIPEVIQFTWKHVIENG
ncbi:hypothetical protein [Arthrobacter antioxidans]|nr:hypothetical protein [Arthrobacter antioxidans]